jgi:glycosyltransferase involved in cell wall biosynthesis
MSMARIQPEIYPRGSSDGRTHVTVVVPCYNEVTGVPHLKRSLGECEKRLQSRYELDFVMVDDGSTDGTLLALREAFADLPHVSIERHTANAGVAAAIMTGIRKADSEIVCSIDSDCTYDPMQLERMLPLMTDDVDLVTASPYHPDGKVLNLPPWRLALSWLASFIYGLVLQLDVHTYTSCFRVYRRSAVSDLALDNAGFIGIPELLWKVSLHGVVLECPAVLSARAQGQSKMRIVSVSIGHMRLLGRICLYRWFGVDKRHRASSPRTGRARPKVQRV